MSNKLTQEVTKEMKTSIIKVLSYEEQNIRGMLSNPLLENEVPFLNLTQLLLIINELLIDISNPQPVTEQRNFNRIGRQRNIGQVVGDPSDVVSQIHEKQPLASFLLTILYRQAASWQGHIKCIESAREQDFVSDLEMIRFILNTLEGNNN